MHFPLLYAARLLMPVFSDITMPSSARAPVSGLLSGPQSWKGGSQLNHQWAVLQFILVSFFPGGELVA